MADGTCSVDGCDRPSNARGWCRPHYQRWFRHGDTDLRRASPQPEDATCSVDGCERPFYAKDLCNMHWNRLRVHGDLTTVLSNWAWKGDDVGYQAAHKRLAHLRGPARDHPCVYCGEQAAQWAYDHSCPDEKKGVGGRGATILAYSTDPDRYLPLCLPCHWRFDRKAAVTS